LTGPNIRTFPGFSGFPGVSGKISENSGPEFNSYEKVVIFHVRLFTPPLVDILILSVVHPPVLEEVEGYKNNFVFSEDS
jgi:hypothetical protein